MRCRPSDPSKRPTATAVISTAKSQSFSLQGRQLPGLTSLPLLLSSTRINSPIATMGISSTCSRPIVNFSGYYRKRASSIELPKATAWFEYLQLSMQTVSKGSTVHYQVQAKYTPPCCQDSELVWTVSRSFDAYRRFRKQLLRRLQLGHACTAECKWLHSVVKNHFPKSKFLAVNSPRTTESRRQSLIRILQTLQASLVNRGNQGCNVLVHGVCYAFAAFILGENSKLPDMDMAMALSRCSSEQSTTNSLGRYSSEQTTRNSFGAKHTHSSVGRTVPITGPLERDAEVLIA